MQKEWKECPNFVLRCHVDLGFLCCHLRFCFFCVLVFPQCAQALAALKGQKAWQTTKFQALFHHVASRNSTLRLASLAPCKSMRCPPHRSRNHDYTCHAVGSSAAFGQIVAVEILQRVNVASDKLDLAKACSWAPKVLTKFHELLAGLSLFASSSRCQLLRNLIYTPTCAPEVVCFKSCCVSVVQVKPQQKVSEHILPNQVQTKRRQTKTGEI